ncbi:Machado-Joseph disease protein MJD [Sesbania bispinosa]|nr:Machado-Joseph disease protein MJD [Sesbania bispinosa]
MQRTEKIQKLEANNQKSKESVEAVHGKYKSLSCPVHCVNMHGPFFSEFD